jgi:hypothetical protein
MIERKRNRVAFASHIYWNHSPTAFAQPSFIPPQQAKVQSKGLNVVLLLTQPLTLL